MLLAKKIDIAVHSLKDLPVDPIPGLELSAILERDDPRDALILSSKLKSNIENNNLTICTSSNRRKSQLLRIYPNVIIKSIRGNVDTRLKKMEDGYCDGIIISAAALFRLGLENKISHIFENNEIISATTDFTGTANLRAKSVTYNESGFFEDENMDRIVTMEIEDLDISQINYWDVSDNSEMIFIASTVDTSEVFNYLNLDVELSLIHI